VSIPLAFLFALRAREAALPSKPLLWLVVFTGMADMGANLAVMIAVQRGPLGVNAVLSSLYPAFTVMAAYVVLKERPTTQQRIGILIAVVAVLLLSL